MFNIDEYRLLLDTLPDVILLCDVGGNIVFCNSRVTELLGYVPQALVGNKVEMLVPPATRAMHVGMRDKFFLATGRRPMNDLMNLQAVHCDGGVQPVSIGLSPVVIDSMQMIIVAIRDNARAVRARQLERLEFEREVQTQRLESLGVLSCGIAHDFKNMLAVVQGYTELMMRDIPVDGVMRENVQAIMAATAKLNALSQQILTYAGGRKPDRRQLRLEALMDEMKKLLTVALPSSTRLSCFHPGQLPEILADSSQISQIMLNLVLNASEAIGNRPGSIVVSTGLEEIAGGTDPLLIHKTDSMCGPYVYLSVADDGEGIQGPLLARIFDPFFTTKSTGKGLGLSLVSNIVQNHDGFIGIQSQINAGTTIRIYFPVG